MKTLLAVLLTPAVVAAAAITGMVVTSIISLPIMLVRGWVLVKLWAWFITPYFDAPAMTIALAMGLVVIQRVVAGVAPAIEWVASDGTTIKPKGGVWGAWLAAILLPLAGLAMGYVIHLFLPH